MTEAEARIAATQTARVRVQASDYAYEGWLIMAGPKRRGAIRCVVEDFNGRLFIHNPAQLTVISDA